MIGVATLGKKYDLEQVDRELGDNLWSPVDVAYINDWVLRAAAIKGEYHWHTHDDDEFFLVYRGQITIDTENEPIDLGEGEGTVIPKGIRHKPRAAERAVILMIEPQRVKSKGD